MKVTLFGVKNVLTTWSGHLGMYVIKNIISITFLSTCLLRISPRSILTVPWIEMGGKINIACAKTGYSSLVEFHTKVIPG